MPQSFDSLCGFLHAYRPSNMGYYQVFKYVRDNQLIIEHYPPVSDRTQVLCGVNNIQLYGSRGLAVERYDVPITRQKCMVTWVAIDIDGADNPVFTPAQLATKVLDILGVYATLRYSKSGTGVHAIIRVKGCPLMDYDTAKRFGRQLVKPYVEMLESNGIVCCVAGLPNLWLYTEPASHDQYTYNAQHSFYLDASDVTINPPICPTPDGSGEAVNIEQFNGLTLDAIRKLQEDKILPSDHLPFKTNVNIGRVRRSLEPLRVRFETKSKCRKGHAHEVNGFIELNPDGHLSLISNPDDNTCILRLVCV